VTSNAKVVQHLNLFVKEVGSLRQLDKVSGSNAL
jgi:hypothetical protein